MVALSPLGVNWCEHVGCWMIVLLDAGTERQLQVALSPEDATVVRTEMAGLPTVRTPLYALIEGLLPKATWPAGVRLVTTGPSRVGACIVVQGDEGRGQTYSTSTADGVVLAIRAGLSIYADEALLERFGVGPRDHGHEGEALARTPVPRVFRRALGEATAEGPDADPPGAA